MPIWFRLDPRMFGSPQSRERFYCCSIPSARLVQQDLTEAAASRILFHALSKAAGIPVSCLSLYLLRKFHPAVRDYYGDG